MEEKQKGSWGGARKGAGRKPSGRKFTGFNLTPEEKVYLRYCLEQYRLGKNVESFSLRMAISIDILYMNNKGEYAAKVGPFIYLVKMVGGALSKEGSQEVYFYSVAELNSLEGFIEDALSGVADKRLYLFGCF